MNRGDIVMVRAPNSPTSKARPCLVVQRGSTIVDGMTKITLCPLTSWTAQGDTVRPIVHPSASSGLRKTSAVEIDWIFTCPMRNVGQVVGTVDQQAMGAVDRALRRWLDL